MSTLSLRHGDRPLDAAILPDYAPPPCAPVRTIGDVVAPAWRHVLSTPGRAALGTVGALAALTALLSLRTVTVDGADADGPYRARCGLDSYVAALPGDAGALCRSAFMSHARIFFLAVLVLVTVSLALFATATGVVHGRVARVRRLLLRCVSTTPRTVALTVAGAAGLLVYLSAWPVTVHLQDERGPLVAQCGLGIAVVDTGSTVVDETCREAYSGRLRLIAAGAVVGAAALGLAFAGRGSANDEDEQTGPDDDAG